MPWGANFANFGPRLQAIAATASEFGCQPIDRQGKAEKKARYKSRLAITLEKHIVPTFFNQAGGAVELIAGFFRRFAHAMNNRIVR
jgi:hypothetical protein